MSDTDFLYFPTYATVDKSPSLITTQLKRGVFDYPFMDLGIPHERGSAIKVNLEDIPDEYQVPSPLVLKGFVFHCSHCGSTLLSRMLAKLPGIRLVSETEAINGLLLAYRLYDLDRQQVLKYLQYIIYQYQQAYPGDEYLLFKTTSWNIYFVDLFQELFPDTPWIYIDRDTEAAVDSSLRDGGGFVQWWDYPTDTLWRHFLGEAYKPNDKRSYVESFMIDQRRVANEHKNDLSLFVKYPEWIEGFSLQLLNHFGLRYSQGELEKAMDMLNFESKAVNPEPFTKVNNK